MLNIILLVLFCFVSLWAVYCHQKEHHKINQTVHYQSKKHIKSAMQGKNASAKNNSGMFSFLAAHEKQIAILLFVVGILIRVSFFWIVPDGLNQDEASIAYDTYADLTYGIDRNGDHNPVYSVAWGSGHSSLYITLSKPWIALFGLNIFTARIVNVLFGCLALFAFYGIMKRLNRSAALIGLFLFAVCPWHIMMSRWGLECNLFPNVFLIGLYFLLRSLDSPRCYPVSLFVFALSLYAYGTAYMVVPVFLLFSAGYLLYHKKISWKMLGVSAAVFVVTAVPIGTFMIVNALGLEEINLGFMTIPRLVSGRYNTTVTILGGNIFATMGANLLNLVKLIFIQNDGLIWNAIPAFGTLYLFSAPFLLLGFCCVLRRAARFLKVFHSQAFVLFMLIAALVLGAMSDLNINRANFVFLPLIVFLAEGVFFVQKYAKWSSYAILPVYLCAFFAFSGYYFTDYRAQIGRAFFAGAGEAIQYASEQTDRTIYLSDKINAPYIIAMFYEKTDPNVFLDTVDYLDPDSECRYVLSFDRYVTGIPAQEERKSEADAAYVLDVTEKESFDPERYDFKRFGYYYVATEK